MIVIPMAGQSSRFYNQGYSAPKYMLEAHGHSLFYHSVNSFNRYFDKEFFLFIVLESPNILDFIKRECFLLGLDNYKVVGLSEKTAGQAETVYEGVVRSQVSGSESLTIFNIDTVRPGFIYPSEFDLKRVDGYLETFVGSGKNWSNVVPEKISDHSVKYTAEKEEISEFCCTGLYYWRSAKEYCRIFEATRAAGLGSSKAGEYYIAPMYNQLIAEGKDVRFSIIESEQVVFSGIPSEYESFKNNEKFK